MKADLFVAPDYDALCEHVARRVAALVRAKPNAVLGLATGSTPLGVYDALARFHRDEGLDFSRVTCFNLDEYYPMTPASPHSYHHFMQEHLFKRINCRRWLVPDGRAGTEQEVAENCRRYEAAIREAGGVDWQLLGIGRTGHIGFNEPGSPPDSRTRLVTLHTLTRQDAAEGFGGLEAVPIQAVTTGIGTILEAREIVLMAHGHGKAAVMREAFEGPPSIDVPASWLRGHANVRLCLDAEAAALFPEEAK